MMKKYQFFFALFALITGLSTAMLAQIKNGSGIRDVDFSNLSYRTTFGDPGEAKTIKLKSGKFEANGKYEEGGQLYELFGKPAFGDLNGDKTEDAVIEIKLSSAPSYRAFEVQAYTLQKGDAKMLARIDSSQVLKDYQRYYRTGDLHYAGTNSPKIQNGSIFVEALMDGSFACPKYTVVFAYKFNSGKFILSGKPTRQSFNCSK